MPNINHRRRSLSYKSFSSNFEENGSIMQEDGVVLGYEKIKKKDYDCFCVDIKCKKWIVGESSKKINPKLSFSDFRSWGWKQRSILTYGAFDYKTPV
jgi:hypothetical protein